MYVIMIEKRPENEDEERKISPKLIRNTHRTTYVPPCHTDKGSPPTRICMCQSLLY